jgi:TM2 domain-containing membrane protein YozV
MYSTYRPSKSVGVAYLLWLCALVGVAGLQHFYVGRWVKGLIWLCTWGLLGVGLLWDLFTLPGEVRRAG